MQSWYANATTYMLQYIKGYVGERAINSGRRGMDTETPQSVGYSGREGTDVSGDGNSTNSKRSDGRNAALWNEFHAEEKAKYIICTGLIFKLRRIYTLIGRCFEAICGVFKHRRLKPYANVGNKKTPETIEVTGGLSFRMRISNLLCNPFSRMKPS